MLPVLRRYVRQYLVRDGGNQLPKVEEENMCQCVWKQGEKKGEEGNTL